MPATITLPLRRVWIAAAGIAVVAALYGPLELDDLPGALRGNGATAPLLWTAVGFLWVWSVVRWEAIAAWYTQRRMRVLTIARWLSLGWAPIFVGLFYVMWVLGRISLGHWPPRNMDDDPKGILLCAMVHMLIIGWFWLLPVAAIVPHLVRAKLMPRARVLGHLGDFAVMAVLIAFASLWWMTDPHALVRWFLD